MVVEKPGEIIMKLIRDYLAAIILAAVGAMLVRTYFVEAYRIPANFMAPALIAGDHIFVNKTAFRRYGLVGPKTAPKRGDIIVFSFPSDSKKDFIKRVVGVAGDEVEIKNRIVYLNGKPLSEPLANDPEAYTEKLDGHEYVASWQRGPYEKQETQVDHMSAAKIPDGQILVLGDNRVHGQDSRNWGFVSSSYVKGRASFIWFSSGNGKIHFNRFFTSVR